MSIELTEEVRQAVKRGEPVRVPIEGRNVVLLQANIYQRIKAILDVERAMIESGQTRSPVSLPEPLEESGLVGWQAELGEEIVILRGDKWEEIRELVEDERTRQAFRQAGLRSAAQWLEENPY